jgi:hypothetical protein
MKRIYVNLTEEQSATLKARAKWRGCPVSEEIRRAVVLSNEMWDIAVARGLTQQKRSAKQIKASSEPSLYESVGA